MGRHWWYKDEREKQRRRRSKDRSWRRIVNARSNRRFLSWLMGGLVSIIFAYLILTTMGLPDPGTALNEWFRETIGYRPLHE